MRLRLAAGAWGVLAGLVVMPAPGRADPAADRARFAAILTEEARRANLPAAIADAVMAVESGYDPTRIGGVGEIGLMQVRPATAAMLGFRGLPAELARPEVNIHYGVVYLAAAWQKAGGDLCTALMKYRAGHGETVMTPRSVTYCARARAHLAAAGSPLAGPLPPGGLAGAMTGAPSPTRSRPAPPLRGAAFWAAHEARIRILSARIERRWRHLASR